MHSRMALRGLTHFAPQLIAMWRQATAAGVTMSKLDEQLDMAQKTAAGEGQAA